ncbi:golgin subfamily A member 4-like [Symsagittifera roscoffensis]|uniref:golgin subfamily A member 4-like n=1 Tax=Symsagittifera roscoffensis TaxID=84072 RepID=UPI00307BB279
MESVERQMERMHKDAEACQLQLLGAFEHMNREIGHFQQMNMEDVSAFETQWAEMVKLVKDYQQSNEQAEKMLGVRESSLHVAEVELGWYKQRCVQLQATIDELADTLEEEIEKREATQQSVSDWSRCHEDTKFKLFEHFKLLQNSFQQLKSTTEKDLENQKSQNKFTNFKLTFAIERYAANVEKEKKELQQKIDQTNEENELLKGELKKAQAELAEWKTEYFVKSKEENINRLEEQYQSRVDAKQDDSIVSPNEVSCSKKLEKYNKALRQISQLVSANSSEISLSHILNQIAPSSSSDEDYAENVVEAVDQFIFKNNCARSLAVISEPDLFDAYALKE